MAVEDIQFVYKKAFCTLQIDNESLCLKAIRSYDSQSGKKVHSIDTSIDLLRVITTSSGSDHWRVDAKNRPMLGRCLSFVQTETVGCFSLTINFWMMLKNYRRQLKTIKLKTYNECDCLQWRDLIVSKVNATLKTHGYVRPQSLLVFVNPHGGKGKGKHIYQNIVSPLFELAKIKAKVIFTEHCGDAKEYFQFNDASAYDGVIAVGGDGTFSDVTNGVLIAEQRKQSVRLDRGDTVFNEPPKFEKPGVKLGMIPAGSANSTNWTSQGVGDPATAALHIICGESHSLDVSSLYNARGNFVQFSIMGSSYGFFSQVLNLSERFRSFSLRYDIATLRGFIKHEEYPCEISYILSDPDNPIHVLKETSRCKFPCQSCSDETLNSESATNQQQISGPLHSSFIASSFSSKQTLLPHHRNGNFQSENATVERTTSSFNECRSDADNDKPISQESSAKRKDEWTVQRGRFHIVNVSTHACIYAKCPNGISPSAHLADGTADLALVRSTSRIQLMRAMMSIHRKGRRPEFPFMEVHRVKGFRLRPLLECDLTSTRMQNSSCDFDGCSQSPNILHRNNSLSDTGKSVWTADGEITDGGISTVWVHKGLINIFATGIEKE